MEKIKHLSRKERLVILAMREGDMAEEAIFNYAMKFTDKKKAKA